jgi:hypothetical protein
MSKKNMKSSKASHYERENMINMGILIWEIKLESSNGRKSPVTWDIMGYLYIYILKVRDEQQK